MRDDLLVQLEEWHEEDEFDQIVEAITEVPAEDRDYELVSHLGRAMSNLGRYDEAIEQFMTVAEEGEDDPLWHYRMGLAYYYLDRYEDALEAFETADKLDPGDEDTLEFLELIRSKNASQPANESGGSLAEPFSTGVAASNRTETDPDLANFWNDSEQALEEYVSDPPTDELIASVEEQLVFKLPAYYIHMMKIHNGGIPHNRIFPIGGAGAEHITISGILGIGRGKKYSLCGASGSRVVIENGGYPEIGVMICNCSAESGIVMLDYRAAGNDGEPEVVYVDKDNSYKITRLAPNFETFIRGLVNGDVAHAREQD